MATPANYLLTHQFIPFHISTLKENFTVLRDLAPGQKLCVSGARLAISTGNTGSTFGWAAQVLARSATNLVGGKASVVDVANKIRELDNLYEKLLLVDEEVLIPYRDNILELNQLRIAISKSIPNIIRAYDSDAAKQRLLQEALESLTVEP